MKREEMEKVMTVKTTKIYREIDKAISEGYTLVSMQGATRSSKTYNALIWLIIYLLTHAAISLSIVRATLPALRGSVLRDFKEILLNMGIWSDSSFNKTELIYTLPNGSFVEFFSTDDEQKLRGRKRDILFVNEANELSDIEFQQLKLRTSLFTIIDYNPSFTEDHWICSVNADPRTYHFISTYKDNPFLPQNIIDEIESLQWKNPALWRVYGLGQMGALEGVIYDYDTCADVPDEVTCYGLDFGYTNDPTALVAVSIHNDDIYLRELCYDRGLLNSDIAHIFSANGIARHSTPIYADSAEPKSIAELSRYGYNVRPALKGKDSICAGIQKVKQYRLHVDKSSANLQRELRRYAWQVDREGKHLNIPVDIDNHLCDAFRYAVYTHTFRGVASTPKMNLIRF